MRRLHTPVDVVLPVADLEAAYERLRNGPDGRPSGQILWLRRTRHDEIHGRVATGPPSMNPGFRGRLEPDGRSVHLVGVLHEAWSEVVTPRMFLVLGAFMLAGTVALAIAGMPVPGALICGPLSVLFTALGVGLGRSRRTSFDVDVEEFRRMVDRKWQPDPRVTAG